MAEYQPIACVQHERLEFSVLRGIPLRIEYRNGTETFCQIVMPLDVATRNGAEWLKFRREDGDDVREIRLDAIISIDEVVRP